MQSISNSRRDQDFYPDDKNLKYNEGKSILHLLTPKALVAVLNDRCTLRQGLEKMRFHRYTAIPVITKDGTYVGTVSEGDFLWNMLDSGAHSIKSQEDSPVSNLIRKGWNPAVKIDTAMDELLLRMMEQNFVPVVDDRDKFIGIITRKDVIKYYYELLGNDESKADTYPR